MTDGPVTDGPATNGPAPSSQPRRQRPDDRRSDDRRSGSRRAGAATGVQPGPVPPRSGRPAGRPGRPAGRANSTDAGRLPQVSNLLGLITLCLVLATVILGLSWLVGGLDVMAVGAVLAVWALCVAARVILGRPGTDWTVPTFDQVVAAGLDGPEARRSPAGQRRPRGWWPRSAEPAVGRPEPAVPSGRSAAAAAAMARSAGTESHDGPVVGPTGGSGPDQGGHGR
ncbi:hypothetical protein [Pseudofrankia inefficax]|uniref:hypothetical protein n=1 Tax=Pseudofrankia inefficax (strain DSM 45817 / CECT 9037 / DDB 130130 / EuI1c) TaxID=298654 RepID=UPI00067416D3|nr:hypothetical protein [Pseudofrankia inefficax]